MSEPSQDTFTGRLIGGCQTHRLIARGGVGALYGAIDVATSEPRAVKVLPLSSDFLAGDHAEAARRFELEAGAAGRLDHPDIVRVYSAGIQGKVAYLVMELLPGTDLRRYTRTDRLLPDAVVIDLCRRLALALAHAHARGIVHRDVKPANVMVDWSSKRLALTDFGVARISDAERTRTGLVLGSPAYMAPELLAGLEAGSASDLYALGVLAYQLLTGQLPFDAEGLGELLRQVAQAPAPRLRTVRPDLAPALDTLIADLLAKRPADRPTDGHHVAQALADLSHA